MITKADYRNYIISHPANTVRKWKLHKLNKPQLKEMWEKLCADKSFDEDKTLLYSDNETEELMKDVDNDDGTNVEDDIYDRLKGDTKEVEEVEEEQPVQEPKAINTKRNLIKTRKRVSIKEPEPVIIIDEVLQESESETEYCSMNDMYNDINSVKIYFRDRVRRTRNVDDLIQRAGDKLNDILDNCIDMSRREEDKIINDFDDFISRYV